MIENGSLTLLVETVSTRGSCPCSVTVKVNGALPQRSS